ncbi:EamA family transporter, partial [Acinetobacter baumannii]|uniref:EamA family transporter n=1 Tax=Acinetobacter baumannii TaxID=470 RepID=UPI001969F719
MNKGVIMAVLAITLWGVAIAPTKWALESFHPFTLMFVRLLLAGLIFLPYAWIKWRKERVLYTIPWMRVSLLSFTGVAGYFML